MSDTITLKVVLPRPVHGRLKARAALDGKSLKTLVRELAESVAPPPATEPSATTKPASQNGGADAPKS
jgi:hypothetical protein